MLTSPPMLRACMHARAAQLEARSSARALGLRAIRQAAIRRQVDEELDVERRLLALGALGGTSSSTGSSNGNGAVQQQQRPGQRGQGSLISSLPQVG